MAFSCAKLLFTQHSFQPQRTCAIRKVGTRYSHCLLTDMGMTVPNVSLLFTYASWSLALSWIPVYCIRRLGKTLVHFYLCCCEQSLMTLLHWLLSSRVFHRSYCAVPTAYRLAL